jgi:hypothetical protein
LKTLSINSAEKPDKAIATNKPNSLTVNNAEKKRK